MKNSLLILFLFLFLNSFGQVPNNEAFTLQNVVDEVDLAYSATKRVDKVTKNSTAGDCIVSCNGYFETMTWNTNEVITVGLFITAYSGSFGAVTLHSNNDGSFTFTANVAGVDFEAATITAGYGTAENLVPNDPTVYNLVNAFSLAYEPYFDPAYYPYYLVHDPFDYLNPNQIQNSLLNFRNYKGTHDGIPTPVATGAKNIGRGVYSISWEYDNSVIGIGEGATEGYYVDISLYSDFHTTIAENYFVGQSSWETFSGVETNTVYYYRVRGKTLNGWSEYSNTCKFRTATDWFLPSFNELYALYYNLKLNDIGGLASEIYWSSTESNNENPTCYPATTARTYDFGGGVNYCDLLKANPRNVRAIRTFMTSYSYSIGEAIYEDPEDDLNIHGYIFYKVDNGDGTYTYYESSIVDQSESAAWSNVTNIAIGATAQGVEIGAGITNTTAIIGQSGHTDSAAKLCNDYNSVIP